MTNWHRIHKNNPMARPLKMEYEGAAHHIISRGNRAEYMEAKKQREVLTFEGHYGVQA